MVFHKSVALLLVSTLALLSATNYLQPTEAHSWAECIDWRFRDGEDWSDNGGDCRGYARRYLPKIPFGTWDKEGRHYQQTHKNPSPNKASPCSDGHHGEEPGMDETMGHPVESAYGGKWGPMTTTFVGDTLCVRWPGKNHASHSESSTTVQINLSKTANAKADLTQEQLLALTIAELPFKNCNEGGKDEEHRPCGGCFKVPLRASGYYLLQWRWMLNEGEWYTSCADIKIGDPKRKRQLTLDA